MFRGEYIYSVYRSLDRSAFSINCEKKDNNSLIFKISVTFLSSYFSQTTHSLFLTLSLSVAFNSVVKIIKIRSYTIIFREKILMNKSQKRSLQLATKKMQLLIVLIHVIHIYPINYIPERVELTLAICILFSFIFLRRRRRRCRKAFGNFLAILSRESHNDGSPWRLPCARSRSSRFSPFRSNLLSSAARGRESRARGIGRIHAYIVARACVRACVNA